MVASIYSFADTEIRCRYREPFLTAGENAARAVVLAPGIYRGFRLLPTATDYELLVRADEVKFDSVAVYLTASGYALTLRRLSDAALDLTAYAGQTLIVAIYATYSPNATTTAAIRVYTVSEYNAAAERGELLVLGRVTVSTSAPVTPTLDGRSVASRSLAPGATPPWSLLRNGGFEAGVVGDAGALTLPFWVKTTVSGTGSWRTRDAVHSTGSLKSLALAYTTGAPYSGRVTQAINAPVTPGQVVRLAYKVRVDAVPVSGTLSISFDYTTAAGASGSAVTTAVSLAATSGGAFVSFELARVVPVEVTHLRSVTITAALLVYGTSADVFHLDDVTVSLLEVSPEAESPVAGALTGAVSAGLLALEDPSVGSYGPASILRHLNDAYDGDPGVVLTGRDGGASLLNLFGRLIVGEAIQSSETTPRLKVDFDSASVVTLLFESSGGSEGALRVYASQDGVLFTVNARWDGSHWTRDVTTTYGSTQLQLATAGLSFYDHNATLADTWNDSYTTGHWEPSFTSPVPASTLSAFLATGLTVGGTVPDTNLGAQTPRLVANRSATPLRSLIAELGPAAPGVRIYRSRATGSVENLEIVHNAIWNSADSEWGRETGAVTSTKFSFGPGGLDVWSSTQTTWSDASWETSALRVSTTPNPATDATPAVNSLHATQVAKAWGRLTTNGSGGVTVTNGFNIAAVLTSGTSLYVTLTRPLANASYVVTASGVPADISTWVDALGRVDDAGHFYLSYFTLVSGVPTVADLRAVAATINFVVFGNQ